jgi:hypothetical protein
MRVVEGLYEMIPFEQLDGLRCDATMTALIALALTACHLGCAVGRSVPCYALLARQLFARQIELDVGDIRHSSADDRLSASRRWLESERLSAADSVVGDSSTSRTGHQL